MSKYNVKGGPVNHMGTFLFVNLPPAAQYAGCTVFCSNARKASEGAGLGTGNLLFSDGVNWIRTDTGAVAAA